MTLHLHHVVNGPYVVCDECKSRINLPHNCCWGQRFIKPSLTKIGMTVKGPHVCKTCKETPCSSLTA